MKSKQLSVVLWDRIVLRHRYGEGYRKMSTERKVPVSTVASIVSKQKTFWTSRTPTAGCWTNQSNQERRDLMVWFQINFAYGEKVIQPQSNPTTKSTFEPNTFPTAITFFLYLILHLSHLANECTEHSHVVCSVIVWRSLLAVFSVWKEPCCALHMRMVYEMLKIQKNSHCVQCVFNVYFH